MDKHIADLRRDYTKLYLHKEDLVEDPLLQFSKWFEEALKAAVLEPNAMTLSTLSLEGKPKSRIVLLKGIRAKNLLFYTNYTSAKAREMEQNKDVAINFFWPELERQVRIEGRVEKAEGLESDEYFHSRPKASQIGAWASPQSEVIESREVLEKRLKEYEEKYKDQEIPRPEHWGGYHVLPEKFEFWQGRASRLHDRFLYTLQNGSWRLDRLAP